MYTFVQQRGGGSQRDPNHKSMYKCAYMYVHLSLSPPPPPAHRSLETSSALQKMAISAEILTQIEETVKLAITNSQTPNLKSIESQLLKLSEAVETYSKKEPMIAQPPCASPISASPTSKASKSVQKTSRNVQKRLNMSKKRPKSVQKASKKRLKSV